jgi:hypothetical protein
MEQCYTYGRVRKERKSREQLKIESQEKMLAAAKETTEGLRNELTISKRFNKVAAVLIILMMCLMVSMLLCIKRQEESFRHLETRYEELREELMGTDYGE